VSRVTVVGLRGVDDDLVRRAASFVARTFVVDAAAGAARPDLEPVPEAGHGQIVSTEILRRLLDEVPDGATRLLGVTEADLYLPTLSFVFGHAQLDGHVAVVSLFRLRPENQGLHSDPERVWDRFTREIAHELGHTWGLQHCADRRCCMSLSTSIDEVDLKTADFCRGCRALLREAQRRERTRPRSAPGARRSPEEAAR
jgi:archaemetzincin